MNTRNARKQTRQDTTNEKKESRATLKSSKAEITKTTRVRRTQGENLEKSGEINSKRATKRKLDVNDKKSGEKSPLKPQNNKQKLKEKKTLNVPPSSEKRRSSRSIKTTPKLRESYVNLKRLQTKTSPTGGNKKKIRFAETSLKSIKKQVKRKVSAVKTNTPRRLRQRTLTNYIEKSVDSFNSQTQSTVATPSSGKVPIYKRDNVEEVNAKAKEKEQEKAIDDLYEFNSEGDDDVAANTKKKKTARKKGNEQDSDFQPPVSKKAKSTKMTRQRKINMQNPKHTAKINTLQKVKQTAKNVKVQQIDLLSGRQEEVHLNDTPPVVPLQTPQKKIHPPPVTAMKTPQRPPPLDNFEDISTPEFCRLQPDANSTMLNNILTPWRFNDINIQRNPHLISYKSSSALPNINQEMVIDYNVVEKFNECSKTPRPEPREDTFKMKNSVQKTLPELFNQTTDKENVKEVSLFDCDELSPIKIHSVVVLSPNKSINNNNNNAKRKILADVTNKQQIVEENKKDDKFFGFDSSLETSEENVDGRKQEKIARPFRLSIKPTDKKYQCKKKQEQSVDKVVMDNADSSSETNESDEEDEEESYSGEAKLFEDYTPPDYKLKEIELVDYKSMKIKEKRTKPKTKKKREKLTKKEEDEMNKWAEKFNSMCQEVEDFPLVIE